VPVVPAVAHAVRNTTSSEAANRFVEFFIRISEVAELRCRFDYKRDALAPADAGAAQAIALSLSLKRMQ
jgi:hypothetical protein